MSVKHVLDLHDNGHRYEAELLGQHRSGGRWRAVVRYSLAAGMTYRRGPWADELRPLARISRMAHELTE